MKSKNIKTIKSREVLIPTHEIKEINQNFIINIDEFYSTNSLTSIIQLNSHKLSFILHSACIAYNNQNEKSNGISSISSISSIFNKIDNSRYLPNIIPYYFEIYGEILTDNEVEIFFNIINNVDLFVSSLLSISKNKDSDFNIFYERYSKRIHPIIFKRILYFTIFTNRIGFYEDKRLQEDGVYFFTVKNNFEKEQKFASVLDSSKFLFHGTDAKNMYSIQRNGIMSMSNSDFQTNGAAYGNGIYLSDLLQFSLGYSRSQSKIILCYEVKNLNITGNNIYVQQENEVCLRAIIWIKDFKLEIDIQMLQNKTLGLLKLSKKYQTTESSEKMVSTNSSIQPNESIRLTIKNLKSEPRMRENPTFKKRVIKETNEIMQLSKNSSYFNRANYLNDNDLTSPFLVEMKIPNDTQLYTQASSFGVNTIVFSIYLGYDYPAMPPKIRILKPRFLRATGHITLGGSICVDTLYSVSWSASLKLESVLVMIISLITADDIDKPSMIDSSRINDEYSYDEFQSSYDTAAISHGW